MFDFLNGRSEGEVFEVRISELVAHGDGIFSLYEDGRLEEMVESVKRYGILTPVIVREKGQVYEILSGHNRVNGAKIAGLKRVPVYNMGELDDEAARFVVTESNVVQRGFLELKISEQARSVAVRHEAMKRQGYRGDVFDDVELILKDDGLAIIPLDNIAEYKQGLYELSPATVRRYVRLDKLEGGLKELVDETAIGLTAGLNLSYMTPENQKVVAEVVKENKVGVSIQQGIKIRRFERENKFSLKRVVSILVKVKSEEVEKYQLNDQVLTRFFTGYKKEDIDRVIVKALEAWFDLDEDEQDIG